MKSRSLSKAGRLGGAILLCVLCLTAKGVAADGNVITDLNLDGEKVGTPPSTGIYHVMAKAPETVLVQNQPGGSSKREIVMTGAVDGSGAKRIEYDYQDQIGGVVDVEIEFTVRQMGGNTEGPETYSNVWSVVLNVGGNNIIFSIGAGEPGAGRFSLAGVKAASGQPAPNLPYAVGQTYKLRFAFNFITEKVDVSLDGTTWVQGAALPDGPSATSGLHGMTFGDGQNIGGGGKHPSQFAISGVMVVQP